MKKLFLVIILFTIQLSVFSQNKNLDRTPTLNACPGIIAPDASYTLLIPSDDGSSSAIPIPFSFCLFGITETTVYVNNNGNVSFGAPLSSFTSVIPMASGSIQMIAPFMSDVDTRGTGTVKYKVTPTAIYVNWEGVGYYNTHTDKTNTFQLIITDGSDPILPAGNNVGFTYGDMQWTTGDASFGTAGLGGSPAIVAIDKGDGSTFSMVGRFNQSGTMYDGPADSLDGVDWLDNQNFYFNSCANNTAPIVMGLSNCDTIHLCNVGDTLLINGVFYSGDSSQTTTVSIDTHSTAYVSVLSNISGNFDTVSVQVVVSNLNAGNHTITFTATDNGIPAGITTTNVYLAILNDGGFTGHIDYSTGTVNNGTVIAYNYHPYFAHFDTAAIANIDGSGNYYMNGIVEGDYLLKVYPNTSSFPNLIPTYSGNAFLWDSATVVSHYCSYMDTVNLTLFEDNSVSGSCMLGGRIVEGLGYVRAPGDPVPGIDVKLGRNPGGQLVTNTETDINGYYSFSGIAYNNPGEHYTIYVDIPGLKRDSSYAIVLDATHVVYDSLNYLADSTSIYIVPAFGTGVGTIAGTTSTFSIYPNPAHGNATIEYSLNEEAEVSLGIYNVLGVKVVDIVNMQQSQGAYKYNVNTKNNSLTAGVYFVTLITNGKTNIHKIVITE